MQDKTMLFDRRHMLMAASAALMVGCSRKGEGKSVAPEGPMGQKQSGGQKSIDAPRNLDGMWTSFRQIYLDASGRIVDTGNGGVSHTEGQGYGMLMAATLGDRPAFEAMYNWTQAHLSRPDMALYSWRYDPRSNNPVADPNNATDGDMLIALALARAARRWNVGAWEARSRQMRQAIRERLVIARGGQHYLMPGIAGFDLGDRLMLNPSYFIFPALDTFAALDGAGAWGPVIATCENLLRKARFGVHNLPTDWIVIGADGMPQPAPDKPPQFGFDAVRVALYAVAARRGALVAPIADYWRGKQAQGQPIPAWVDVYSGAEAPYALSPGGLNIVQRTLNQPLKTEALAQDYYGCVLQLLTRNLR
ncbi:glycosyl hydrolase family 8 [Novosphingobium sp. KACC 22771]|uniref:glycosyl hydrolase family 8 n=1 Tax=Novosphingobium sp. KACC 22771 TaxID=3025670 RepID=UPI0023658CF4|nr:glycosyl hydrolase family 8 [Novosphingobium sp. KACC 22771]WDF73112.1 glycosyl hydrolase family 8 [Novosphingobium sp. KACC 22771]